MTSTLPSDQRAAGTRANELWTTGGGVGLLLIDEVQLVVDVKAHHFSIETPRDLPQSYTNVTVGAELGWRFFLWKGLNLGLVVRYWPQVHSSAPAGLTLHDARGAALLHHPLGQGIAGSGAFANLLLGWAFNL